VTPDPSTAERKLAAKRFNERVKLGASFLSTLAVGILGAAVIVPLFSPGIRPSVPAVGAGILVGVSLHPLAQWVFRFLRSED
jgi:hypothetical protein